MYREIKFDDDARARIKAGIDQSANAVKITLGIKGRNVIIDTSHYSAPTNTNDGVTIVRELILRDRYENIGAKIVKEIAGRTNDAAGDGTTTASVLVQAIVNEGTKAIAAGADAVSVRKGIEKAAIEVIGLIKKETVKADDLETLTAAASISCGDPELGRLVAECVKKAGPDGMVALEDNAEAVTVAEGLEGLRLRGSFTVPHFINVPEMQQALYNNVPVFVTNQTIATANEMIKIMEAAYQLGKKEVVIIANSIDGDALLTAIKNVVEGKFKILPIRCLAYGDMGEGMLRDVAAITGATFYDGAASMSIMNATKDDLGSAAKIVADKHYTTVITSVNELKVARIAELKAQIGATDREFEKESLKERIAKLSSGMFTIKVGGITDTERTERKLRIEDAINATRAAQTDGVVAGGGATLYRASQSVKWENSVEVHSDESFGFKAVLKACLVPIEQMAINASLRLDRSDLTKLVKGKKSAIDFNTGEVVDAFKAGIIDPVKVVVSALSNAASGAALFLVSGAAIVLQEAPKEEQI